MELKKLLDMNLKLKNVNIFLYISCVFMLQNTAALSSLYPAIPFWHNEHHPGASELKAVFKF